MARIVKEQEEVEDKFFTYVKEKIEYMRGFLNLGKGDQVNFYELQKAFVEYPEVFYALLSLKYTTKSEWQDAKDFFDMWWAGRFLAIRAETNRKEDSAQKWASQKELEMMTMAQNSIEYTQKKRELLDFENKHHFVVDLLKGWESYQFVLSGLSNNVRSEVGIVRNNFG